MGRVVLSPRAKIDIDRIWSDSAETWGVDQAETYIRQIARHIEMIAVNPAIGRACPNVRAGYRKFPSGSHLIFYRQSDDGIAVVRVLHQRMDVGLHL